MEILKVVLIVLGAVAGFFIWYKWAEERVYKVLVSRLDKEALEVGKLVEKYRYRVGLVTLLISFAGLSGSFHIGILGYFFIPLFGVLMWVGISRIWKIPTPQLEKR